MNLEKLFNMQAQLDADILAHHPVQEGEDRLSKKVLALLVELGECAQEWRGFKFWSNDQKARELVWINEDCKSCKGSGVDVEGISMGNPYPCIECEGKGVVAYSKNPLLEEYVDCLHFILSIGNELGIGAEHEKMKKFVRMEKLEHSTVTELFTGAFEEFSRLATLRGLIDEMNYVFGFLRFLNIGANLGFTWEQIEQAYYDKNKVNFERQANGY